MVHSSDLGTTDAGARAGKSSASVTQQFGDSDLPHIFCHTGVFASDRRGLSGDEVRARQFLPLRHPNADIDYKEIVPRRSNRVECPFSEP
jgi:hypothetical protein